MSDSNKLEKVKDFENLIQSLIDNAEQTQIRRGLFHLRNGPLLVIVKRTMLQDLTDEYTHDIYIDGQQIFGYYKVQIKAKSSYEEIMEILNVERKESLQQN